MTRTCLGQNAATAKNRSDQVSSKPVRSPCFGCQILLGLMSFLGKGVKQHNFSGHRLQESGEGLLIYLATEIIPSQNPGVLIC